MSEMGMSQEERKNLSPHLSDSPQVTDKVWQPQELNEHHCCPQAGRLSP